MNEPQRWRLWAQRCADLRTLATSLTDTRRSGDDQLRMLRDKQASLLDALVDEVRSLEHRCAILEKMAAEQAARRQDLLQHVPVACVLTNAQGQIVDANREAAQLLNSSVRSLVTRPVEIYLLNRTQVERATARLEDLNGRLHLQVVVKPREKPPIPASLTIQRAEGTAAPEWGWFFLPQRTAVHN